MLAHTRRHLFLTAALALAATSIATEASAGAFAIREQSATGQGAGFAGMAAGGGGSISGMFWNPAVISQVDSFQGENHATMIVPSSKLKADASTKATLGAIGGSTGDAGDIGELAFVTSSYNAYRINDRLTVGLSITTPFGLATKPDRDWAGQVYGRVSKARSINAAPTVAYQVNDWLAIAGGVQVQWFDVKLNSALGVASGAPTGKLKADDIGVGFTAGVLLTPWEGTSVGVGFRSAIKHDLEGKLSVPGPNPKLKANMTLPETVSVGVRQKATDQLTLLAGVEWTNWSRLGKVAVNNKAGGPDLTTIQFNYRDAWFFSAGAEYAIDPAWTIRGGLAYEVSPVSDKVRSVRLPDANRWWLSAGASYTYSDRLSFDLGYSYIFTGKRSKIDVRAGDVDFAGVPFSGSAKTDIHLLSVGLRYKFGGGSPAPLVAKY